MFTKEKMYNKDFRIVKRRSSIKPNTIYYLDRIYIIRMTSLYMHTLQIYDLWHYILYYMISNNIVRTYCEVNFVEIWKTGTLPEAVCFKNQEQYTPYYVQLYNSSHGASYNTKKNKWKKLYSPLKTHTHTHTGTLMVYTIYVILWCVPNKIYDVHARPFSKTVSVQE